MRIKEMGECEINRQSESTKKEGAPGEGIGSDRMDGDS